MTYELSLLIDGPGSDPNHRSHWSFLLHRPGSTYGTIMHVELLDLSRLWYQCEERTGAPLSVPATEGRVRITKDLSEAQGAQVKRVVAGVGAPRDGRKRCKDWCLDVVVELEVEGLVEAGCAEWVGGLVGLPAKEVKGRVGREWV
jgi:hypothetical protein